jgi:fatty acid desaturase
VWTRPSVISIVMALVLLGGRQLALAILTHEAVHKTLFASRSLNEWVGTWLCANPMAIDLEQYRAEHFQHHKETGEPGDPDRGLVNPYPVSKGSMMRKCARDLLGVTGIKRIYFIVLMGFGFLTYTLSTNTKPIDQRGRSPGACLKIGFFNLYGAALTNLILFAILCIFRAPWLFLLWIGAYLSTFSLFLRIRSVAEHACTPDPSNALLNTRTTYASPLARLTVAPHRVNYHLEHHIFMQVPYFNLLPLHRLLTKHGVIQRGCTARNYWDVLKLATKK